MRKSRKIVRKSDKIARRGLQFSKLRLNFYKSSLNLAKLNLSLYKLSLNLQISKPTATISKPRPDFSRPSEEKFLLLSAKTFATMKRLYDAGSVTPSVTAGTRSETERTCGRRHATKCTLKACPTNAISYFRPSWGTLPASVKPSDATAGSLHFISRTRGYREGDASSVLLGHN